MRKPSGRHRGTNKTLSFTSVILLGINGIIGSGIFLLPGTLYQEAGLGSVSAIVLAGLSTTLIALSYAMLASKIDDDGGCVGLFKSRFWRFCRLSNRLVWMVSGRDYHCG